MKKLLSVLLLIGLLFPTITEAGFSPEGRPNRPRNHFPEGRPRKRKPRCKGSGGVVVCRMPKPRKCTRKKPCIPKGYYRKNPPRVIPMG
jgi:hypothetical protein